MATSEEWAERVRQWERSKVEGDQAELTPVRFPGQCADEETGLYHNRYRYYDPETGQYLSPEPIRLEGSVRAYAYVDGWPLEFSEHDDLAKMHTEVTGAYVKRTGSEPMFQSTGTLAWRVPLTCIPQWRLRWHRQTRVPVPTAERRMFAPNPRH
ncbi:RHS repeat-associated core domain-containing protein [Sorangium sp. So ce204]|uniref:RHS repeat-associated core domain-containing protein n=1 Tax=Sorangium sp. So ce204 TaxID=3133288 RepID=UPI003F636F2A